METKTCKWCFNPLPVSDFGVCRSRQDGLNPYCRKCTYAQVKQCRQRFRLPPSTPVQKITKAISRGCHSRLEIRRAVNMDWDLLMDVIADLFDQGALTTKVIQGERCFYIRRAAA